MSAPKNVIFDKSRIEDFTLDNNSKEISAKDINDDDGRAYESITDNKNQVKTVFPEKLDAKAIYNAFSMDLDTNYLMPSYIDHSSLELREKFKADKQTLSYIFTNNDILEHIKRNDLKHIADFTNALEKRVEGISVIVSQDNISVTPNALLKNQYELIETVKETVSFLKQIEGSLIAEKSLNEALSRIEDQKAMLNDTKEMCQKAIDICNSHTLLDANYLEISSPSSFIDAKKNLIENSNEAIKALDEIKKHFESLKSFTINKENAFDFESNNDCENERENHNHR